MSQQDEYLPELRTEHKISRLRRKNLRYTGQSMDVLYEAGIVRDLLIKVVTRDISPSFSFLEQKDRAFLYVKKTGSRTVPLQGKKEEQNADL